MPDEEIKNFIAENGEEYSNKGLQIDFSEENSRQVLIVGITHNIKSPLTSVIGYVEGLCDGVADTQENSCVT